MYATAVLAEELAQRSLRAACAAIAASGVWDEEAQKWESSELIAATIRARSNSQ